MDYVILLVGIVLVLMFLALRDCNKRIAALRDMVMAAEVENSKKFEEISGQLDALRPKVTATTAQELANKRRAVRPWTVVRDLVENQLSPEQQREIRVAEYQEKN